MDIDSASHREEHAKGAPAWGVFDRRNSPKLCAVLVQRVRVCYVAMRRCNRSSVHLIDALPATT
jgi:hypothetical protein